jgi:8-oxo-dGTP diphosphatase
MSIPTKAVKGIILNKEKELLLLQRNPNQYGTDVWDLPGGLIDHGEKEEDALIRETREELSVNIIIKEKSKKWSFIRLGDEKEVVVQNYICQIIDGDIKLSEEHKDYKWAKLENIKQYRVKNDSFYKSLENL